jgi:TetR/AcrR family transcriptional regulator
MTLEERRQRERDQRRDNIVNAANQLFFRKGFDEVSMEEIANEVELSKSTLYFYFKDKELLYFAIVNRGVKILRLIVVEEISCIQKNGLEVEAIHRAFNRFILEHPDYAQAYIYFRSGRFDLSNNETVNADIKEVLEFTEELITKAVLGTKNYMESGTFRSDINPATLTAFNFLMNESILTISKDLKNMLEDHGITMLEFYLTITNLANLILYKTEETEST